MVCSDKAIAPGLQNPITGNEVEDLGYTVSVDTPAQYIDPHTGQVIPWAKIIASVQHLDPTLKKLEEGMKVFANIMKETQNFETSSAESNEASGCKCTGIFDELSSHKIIFSMMVGCPCRKQEAYVPK